MNESPAGHTIAVVTGNASGIRSRGEDIEQLGDKMIVAAKTLDQIASDGESYKGLSLDKIKEVIGEIDDELRLAGDRYKPTGTALKNYSATLDAVQSAMTYIVPRCQEAWEAYSSANFAALSTEYEGPSLSWKLKSDEEQNDARESAVDAHNTAVAKAQNAAAAAHNAFLAEARFYDVQYDSWEAAFETAANAIGTATTGGIEDSGWDNFDGFIDGVLVVLQWAGVVLAVLAFIVGGPIIAALGAIVAVVALALTIYKAARGNSDPLEVGLAIVGVIPFGSLAKFSGGFRAGSLGFLDDMVGGLGSQTGRAAFGTAVREVPMGVRNLFSSTGNGWTKLGAAFGGTNGFDDLVYRMFGHGDATSGARALENIWGAPASVLGHYGWIVNSPVMAGMFVHEKVTDALDGATIQSWQEQLAGASN